MNFRGTAILLAVLLVLGAGVWWFELREPPKTTDSKLIPVLDLKSEDVNRLEVIDAGKLVRVLKSDTGIWRLAAPEDAEADVRRVDDVISRVTKLNATRQITETADLGAFGLLEPKVQATFGQTSGASIGLLVGEKTPDGASYYAKRSDQAAVYVVPSYVISDLTRLVSDPPKPRPTPTSLPALATPIGGLAPLPPSPTLTPRAAQP